MLICPTCCHSNQNSDVYCGSCGSQLARQFKSNVCSFVTISPTGDLNVRANNKAEAKLALKELNLKKKEFSLLKKQVIEQERQIRADYTEEVRSRGSKFRGGGRIGNFIRTIQTINRDTERRNLAAELSPLEQKRNLIEAVISGIEQAKLQVESYLLRQP